MFVVVVVATQILMMNMKIIVNAYVTRGLLFGSDDDAGEYTCDQPGGFWRGCGGVDEPSSSAGVTVLVHSGRT